MQLHSITDKPAEGTPTDPTKPSESTTPAAADRCEVCGLPWARRAGRRRQREHAHQLPLLWPADDALVDAIDGTGTEVAG